MILREEEEGENNLFFSFYPVFSLEKLRLQNVGISLHFILATNL